ncbi:MAG: SseB family protein [Elusimicrobia bacterium]|nr:SseB family protein [Elusimicrobiota bacterium]
MTEQLIPPKAVEGLMTKAFIDQSVAAGLFWDALLKCELYVPISDTAETAGEDEIPMLLGVGSGGELVVWLFTSPEAMIDYTDRELTYRAVPAKRLLASVADSEHDVVLIGPDGLTLSLHPDLIQTLADGRVPEPPDEDSKLVSKQAQIYVGPPSDCAELENRFIELFQTLPQVLEAAFLQVADSAPKGAPAGTRLLLGLRLEDPSEDGLREVAGKVARAAEGVLEKGKNMDITLIDRSLKSAFENWGKSFFKR